MFNFLTPVVCCFCGHEEKLIAHGDLIGNQMPCPKCKKTYVLVGRNWDSNRRRVINTEPPDDFLTDEG